MAPAMSPMLLACFLCGTLSMLRGAEGSNASEPDLNIVFQNNCPFPVRFLWDQNIGGEVPSVIVLYNQRITGRDQIVVQTARKAGGRVYVISADDSNGSTTADALPRANIQDALTLLGDNNVGAVRARYGTYLIAGEPRAWYRSDEPPGQLVEFTMTHLSEHIYDADISNVFYLNGAVGVEMLYANGKQLIDTLNCRNTSNPAAPDQPGCENAGGVWIPYPKAMYGPSGMCQSPNIACIPDPTKSATTPVVCNKFDSQLAPLISFLNANRAAVGYAPQLGGDDISHSTRVYTCDGFMNNPGSGFMLASTCASLNRGQCPMPTGTDLANTDNFKKWVQTTCGPEQFMNQDESTWFKHTVRNPWAEYIRQTMGSSGYSFAQDEGPYGGNSQCLTNAAHGWTAPTGMRIVACPGSTPSPAPSPTPSPAPPAACNVGDHVYCPGETTYQCTGAQCCKDGTTCPSAPNSYEGCAKPKTIDCTTATPTPSPAPSPTPPAPHAACNVGDHVYCPGETTYQCTGAQCCKDGTTCPSAPSTYQGCSKPKTIDCTTATSSPAAPTPSGVTFV